MSEPLADSVTVAVAEEKRADSFVEYGEAPVLALLFVVGLMCMAFRAATPGTATDAATSVVIVVIMALVGVAMSFDLSGGLSVAATVMIVVMGGLAVAVSGMKVAIPPLSSEYVWMVTCFGSLGFLNIVYCRMYYRWKVEPGRVYREGHTEVLYIREATEVKVYDWAIYLLSFGRLGQMVRYGNLIFRNVRRTAVKAMIEEGARSGGKQRTAK